jgi:hypothetical protein
VEVPAHEVGRLLAQQTRCGGVGEGDHPVSVDAVQRLVGELQDQLGALLHRGELRRGQAVVLEDLRQLDGDELGLGPHGQVGEHLVLVRGQLPRTPVQGAERPDDLTVDTSG